MRRGIGDEPVGLERQGQDVAAPAAADQDLPPAVRGALHEHDGAGPPAANTAATRPAAPAPTMTMGGVEDACMVAPVGPGRAL